AIIGVQVLFGFLLAIPFAQGFSKLTAGERNLYLVDLLLAAFATALLIAPVAHHRLVFRRHQKRRLLFRSNAIAVVGLVTVGAAVTGSVLLVCSVVFSSSVAIVVGALTALGFAAIWFVLPGFGTRPDDY